MKHRKKKYKKTQPKSVIIRDKGGNKYIINESSQTYIPKKYNKK
jgi:hypothetical protein